MEAVDTSHTQNPNAVPIPADVAASYRLLAESMQALMRDNPDQGMLDGLLDQITSMIESPPTKVQGVPQEYLDGQYVLKKLGRSFELLAGLERVPKKSLKKTDECPICSFAFLDGMLTR